MKKEISAVIRLDARDNVVVARHPSPILVPKFPGGAKNVQIPETLRIGRTASLSARFLF